MLHIKLEKWKMYRGNPFFPSSAKEKEQHFYPFRKMLGRNFFLPFPTPTLSGRVRFWKAGIHWVVHSPLMEAYFSLKNKQDWLPPFFWSLATIIALIGVKTMGSLYSAHCFQLVNKAGKPSLFTAVCTICPASGWLCR